MEALILGAIVFMVLLTAVAYVVLMERRVAAWMQDRLGPNRVGPLGLFQPLADGLKIILKEDIIPRHVDKIIYVLAPAIVIVCALITFAVVPFGYVLPVGADGVRSMVIAPDIDIAIIFILAVGGLAGYGVLLGGWGSNNKYAFLGGLRATASILSYEIPASLALLCVVLLTGTLNLEKIVEHQAQGGWNFYIQPIACLLFVISGFAECNRLPFDLPECEQELVAGYHTEYSSWKFGLYFFAEYTHIITVSFLITILFFGGWHLPWLAPMLPPAEVSMWGGVARILIMVAKVFFFVFFFMWVRWTIPRFRFDQLLSLAWKVMVPLGILAFTLAAVGVWRDVPWYVHTILNVVGILLAMAYAGWTARMPEPGVPAVTTRKD
jgi:NADH-quinone oxidoreductase subunit H